MIADGGVLMRINGREAAEISAQDPAAQEGRL